jgi:hypothetical protein
MRSRAAAICLTSASSFVVVGRFDVIAAWAVDRTHLSSW